MQQGLFIHMCLKHLKITPLSTEHTSPQNNNIHESHLKCALQWPERLPKENLFRPGTAGLRGGIRFARF